MMRRRLFFLIIDAILVFILHSSFYLSALDANRAVSQYSMRSWDMESGLPANSVYAILQTHDGYLWIGTSEGLVRFDGLNFEIYDSQTIPQLKNNQVYALYEDRQGTLWIGTVSGGIVRYRERKFFNFPATTHNYLYKIRAINEDRWGNLWIGSFTGGLTCYSGGKFTNYKMKNGLPDDQVRCLFRDGNKDLWVATTAGVVKINEPGNFLLSVSQEALPFYQTVCLYEEDTTALWIGTGGNGLFRLKNGKFTDYGSAPGIPGKTIYCLFRDRTKNLWIGTDGGGLIRINDQTLSRFPGEDSQAWGPVSAIYEDREGSLWIGTLDGGLHQLRDSTFINYTTREGLTHDYIDCIYEDRSGAIWIGADRGLNRLENGTITTILTSDKSPVKKPILQLCEDSKGYLWIGALSGLFRFKNGNLAPLTRRHGLSDDRITCITRDSKDNIWVGAQDGLNLFNDKTGSFIVFGAKNGLHSNLIRFVFEDRSGVIWIGTNTGLNYFEKGVFSIYNPTVKLEDRNFRCAYQDNAGTLWFGSDSGLIRLQPGAQRGAPQSRSPGISARRTTLYNTACGLVENYVYTILEDEHGYLWFAGRNGISRAAKKELADFASGQIDQVHPDVYNEQDGMKSRWCTGAACKTRDGRFWFPTSLGAAVIDPARAAVQTPRIGKAKLLFTPIIQKFIADGEPIDPHDRANRKKAAALAPGIKRLEFYYTVVSFINPQRIRFRARLVGWDSNWLVMGNLRSTAYTRLKPGHYTFEVAAGNPEGAWSEQPARLSFYIQPYFYQTGWFFIFMSLLAITLLFFIYRLRIMQLQARERRRQLIENLKQGRRLLPGKDALSPPDREFIDELQQAIDKNLANPDFNVTQLGRQLYMSRVTLYRKIYALTGETPVEFLNSCRLKKAAELLESDFGSVLEVALEVGFSSASYFTTCFKKKFGSLPTHYQESRDEKET